MAAMTWRARCKQGELVGASGPCTRQRHACRAAHLDGVNGSKRGEQLIQPQPACVLGHVRWEVLHVAAQQAVARSTP